MNQIIFINKRLRLLEKFVKFRFDAGIVLSGKQVGLVKRKQIEGFKCDFFAKKKSLSLLGLFNRTSFNLVLLKRKQTKKIYDFITKKSRDRIKKIYLQQMFWKNNKIKIAICLLSMKKRRIKSEQNQTIIDKNFL